MRLNILGLHEYTRQDLFIDATDEVREADRFYIMTEADEVIAEKDKEIARLEAIRKVHVEAIASMEAGLHQDEKEIRRLKRALFIALAYKAKYKKYWYCELLEQEGSKILSDNKKAKKYNAIIKMCQKCEAKYRAKAEEYK